MECPKALLNVLMECLAVKLTKKPVQENTVSGLMRVQVSPGQFVKTACVVSGIVLAIVPQLGWYSRGVVEMEVIWSNLGELLWSDILQGSCSRRQYWGDIELCGI